MWEPVGTGTFQVRRVLGSFEAALLPGKGLSLRPGFCTQPLSVSSVTSDKLWRSQPYQASVSSSASLVYGVAGRIIAPGIHLVFNKCLIKVLSFSWR